MQHKETATKKKNKRVMGIGFGNIFSGKQIELKTKENFNISSSSSPSPSNNGTPSQIVQKSGFLKSSSNSATARIKARVLYDYEPLQPDELKLTAGEFVYILDKNLEDEGWWRGESLSTGKIGVFPDNFIEQLPNEGVVNGAGGVGGDGGAGGDGANGAAKRKSPPRVGGASVKNVINDFNLISSSSSSSSTSSSSSSPSTNSSNNSLSASTKQQQHQAQHNLNNNPTTVNNNKQHHQHNHSNNPPNQLIQSQTHHQPQQSINSSIEENNNNSSNNATNTNNNKSQSQSDLSEDLEDIQQHSEHNKLTHIKKTRQFNKRPPSFRSKNLRVIFFSSFCSSYF